MLAEHRGHREFTNDLDPIQRQIAVDLGGGEFLTLWSFHTRNDSYDDDNEDKDSTFRKRRLAVHRKFTCPFCDSCRGRVAEKRLVYPGFPILLPCPSMGQIFVTRTSRHKTQISKSPCGRNAHCPRNVLIGWIRRRKQTSGP